MHELSLAAEIVAAAEEAILSAGSRGARPLSVKVRVGGDSGVSPEALVSAWEFAASGTRLAGSSLDIELIPGGAELEVSSVEVEDEA